MLSKIGCGFRIVRICGHAVLVIRRIADAAWGLFSMTPSDLVRLRDAAERDDVMPILESVRCLTIARTQRECVEYAVMNVEVAS